MFKKILSITGLALLIAILSCSKIYAAIDIVLEDNPEEDIVEVVINSNDSTTPGIDLNIIYSKNLVINDISNSGNFCSFGFETLATNGIITIECLNSEDIAMNNTLATIDYSIDTDNYYFYTDSETLDIADNEIGKLEDINKPEETQAENTSINEKKSFTKNLIDFIREYYLYIAAMVMLISISLVFFIVKNP